MLSSGILSDFSFSDSLSYGILSGYHFNDIYVIQFTPRKSAGNH